MSSTIYHRAAQDNSNVFPMSFPQEGFWLLDQLEPGSTANTLLASVEISKSLIPEVLESSLNQLVQRHAILRTTFHLHDSRLLQMIAPGQRIPLLVIDRREITIQQSQAQPSAQVQHLTTRHAQEPFDLSQGPLLHCTLLLLSSERSILLLTLHRIISDAPSLGLIVGELAYLYEAALRQQPSPLPPLSTSYAEVAAAQRAALNEETLTEHLAYWKSQVEGVPTALQLPTDYPRPAIASSQGIYVERVLPTELLNSLRSFNHQGAESLHNLLIAAWGVVLARFSGQDDLLIGTIVPGDTNARYYPTGQASKTDTLPGSWEDPLLVRINLSSSPSVSELLERVQVQIHTAQKQAALPFDRLVKELAPSRSLDHSPLFQAQIRLPWSPPSLPSEWCLGPVEVGLGSAPVDLSMELDEVAEGLRARLHYRTDLFVPTTMERLIECWQILLEGMVADPNQSVMRLPFVSESERRLLLEEWTATRKDLLPLDRTLVQLFEEQVERSPNAIAAICEGEQLSYRQLNEQANQLAHLLRELGVEPETLVALMAERGLPLLLWILAVFKAGGAYLPLDPHHPETRLQRVLEQSGCHLVLSSAEYAKMVAQAIRELPEETRPRCLTYEELPLVSQCKENLVGETRPNSLMYVIYTSGSTGRPKGAMVEQRGMLNHLYAKIEGLSLSAADTVAQTASQCFDISVWQFLAALLVGGRVQIYPDAISHDPLALLQHVEAQQVSILETVPSLLRAMLETSQHPALPNLRWLIPTGEALPVELCQHWLQCYPHIPLLNAYGPTECSDDVTHYAIYEPPAQASRSIPIGKAIPNLRLYVLDRYLQPVPIGVSGELYVGGIGVGRGYRNDAQRTAEAFVKDPFSQEAGARLYKTGDLGRYLPDGNLEFLGRVDFQVKLRGFRIELGEIEAVLNQHPAVREVVVLVREEVPGEQRLIAYVVPQEGKQVRSEELKRDLMQQVPSYMVPSAFVLLEKLPLTTNGKLDRAGLPVPEWSREEQKETYVAPVSPLQQQLVKLWDEVLGVPQIGIRDDFFALGGDSLQAVRLFARIEQEYGKRLPLSTLFAGATIEQVAEVLLKDAQIKTTSTRAPLVTVQAGGSKRPFFFLHGQWEGGALYSLELARTLGPEQPFYLLEPYKFDGLAVPPSLEKMAAAHLATLRAIQPEGPYLLGGWCNGGLIAYEMARQLHAQGQAVDLLVLMDSDAPAPRFKWDRRIITGLCKLFLLGQKQEVDLFLLYRYLRLSYYYWRLRIIKFLKNDKHSETGSASSVTNALFPKSEVLRQDWLSIYDWIAAGYMPHSYSSKITFFWTEEEPLRRRGWSKLIKGKEVDIHTIPGNHLTSRTRFLPILADHLRTCLENVL